MAENETATDIAEAEVTATDEIQEAPETATPKQDIPVEVKRALSKANKEAETLRLRLKEYEDRDKTETQKLQEERDALLNERNTLALENLRREVADEKGLTPAQARRLVGSSREELEADADDVIATFPVKTKPVFGDVGQGARAGSAQRVYTTKEISDFQFYQKNKEDILLAQREGRITD
jgi:hypothetical protein